MKISECNKRSGYFETVSKLRYEKKATTKLFPINENNRKPAHTGASLTVNLDLKHALNWYGK
jgi:hypothetical protein